MRNQTFSGRFFFSDFGPAAAWLAAPRPGTPGRPGQAHQGGQGGGEAREARPGPRVARKCLIISSFKNQGGPDANQLPLTDSKKLPFCIGFNKESSILGATFFFSFRAHGGQARHTRAARPGTPGRPGRRRGQRGQPGPQGGQEMFNNLKI